MARQFLVLLLRLIPSKHLLLGLSVDNLHLLSVSFYEVGVGVEVGVLVGLDFVKPIHVQLF